MNGAAGSGTVVLAAFRPDPELFAVQLRSIRDQTLSEFHCLVGADGGQAEVRRLVATAVGDDPRFEVIGWDDNLGFYLNFERLLAAVPEDVAWVALSDQDDRWYPDKLERLVPLLERVPLATGQARVVRWPGQDVVLERTDRRVVAVEDLLFQNQVTGSLAVLRRELLDLALPFPRLNTVTQLHDHWLGLCAVSVGGYAVLDDVVQDYIQHGNNLVGEVATQPRWTALTIFRRWIELADRYAGGHTMARMLATSNELSFGWRRTMLCTLSDRRNGSATFAPEAQTLGKSSRRHSLLALARAARSRNVSTSTLSTFLAGLPAEIFKPYDPRQTPPQRSSPRP